ncbi:hypothetical protein [Desulfoluna butyratoxydans]|uniref:hypothetical protein n=1 Tax=Desulfoluna butyratoxydans TaxID=231438 RepID=UPI0015D15058|nr:hypothetical protein [Desulfoluna butyratoxydans]
MRSILDGMRVVEETEPLGVFCKRFGVPFIDGATAKDIRNDNNHQKPVAHPLTKSPDEQTIPQHPSYPVLLIP